MAISGVAAAAMDEKGSLLRRHALHSEDGKAAVTRKPGAIRRSGCLVVAAALALSTLVLLFSSLSGSGGLCRHVRLQGAGGGAQAWAEALAGGQPPDHPAAGSSGAGGPGAPSAESSRGRGRGRVGPGPGAGAPVVLRRQPANVTTTSAAAAATVLEDFEVHQPVLTPSGATLDNGDSTGDSSSVGDSCSVVLMDHIFAYSYGTPYVGSFTPPDCDFNRVVINYTVVSEGRQ